ncbi:hypothetical protein HUJ05_006621 [Dendroctonus ponderosae]|nr:hypothetical protein HUJ05_006620 [Dendroctonus ponderosae]KAH1018947.1 hypothetical protein HUJ05_006621 [Dendroctonus ponderosae]
MIIGTLMGTQAISERFLSKLHLVNIDFPDKEDLSVIVVAYLSAIIRSFFSSANFPKPKVVKLAITMITIFNKIRDTPELHRQGFGSINPHDLVGWCNHLQFYSTLHDRLARVEQKQTLLNILNDSIKADWDLENIADQASRHYYVSRGEALNKATVFEKLSKKNWEMEVQRGIVQFGKESQDLDTIINDEILSLTAAVTRAALIPQYNLVLLGKSGLGRKTAIKISSALLSKRIIHPCSGSPPLFPNDLKLAVQYAGLECEDVLLILEDYVFCTQLNMTIINLLMSAGEAPDLYSDIEMDSLVKGLKDKLDSDNFEGDLNQYFATNIKKHLHVFICLDQDSEGLRDIIVKCPALSQNSGLVWIEKWSGETIKSFPQKLIHQLGGIDANYSTSTFEQIYKSLPSVTPTRYICMVKLCYSVYKENESSINSRITKLELMGTQDTSWNSMKTFLAKRGVKEDIRSFDASRIQTENRQAVERLMSTKRDSFDQKSAKRASVAAAPLAAWVDANVKYSRVLDKIRPLEREQNKLKQNLDNAETQLVELNANLSDVDATVAKLKEQLSQFTKEAAEIEIGLNEVNRTLASAENLVYKLEDEYQRWQEQLKELSKELEVLPNDSLLAAAFITFLSEEEEINRRNILTTWCSLLGKDEFDLMAFFASEREQLQWQSEGLPNDRASLENAVAMKKPWEFLLEVSSATAVDIIKDMVRYERDHGFKERKTFLYGLLSPLVVDPNSTAAHWLKAHYTKSKQNFEHIAANSPKLNTVLEAGIRFGKILLIEELESVPHHLFPILRSDFVVQGRFRERKMIRMFGKLVDCHSDFKVIMCSRNERIKLPAEIASYICNLLATLNETKSNSTAVTAALDESTKVQNDLRKEYEMFLDISSYGSRLYFACREFGNFHILYSVSAGAFSRIFLLCLQTTQSQADNPEIQTRHLFQSIYNYMARGMFKSDKLTFFLHLVCRMFPIAVPEVEMRLFLANNSYQKLGEENDSDLPGWIQPFSVPAVLNIKNALPDLYKKLQLNETNLWTSFMESTQCEKEFPKHCHASEFQKLLVVQCLRPDKLLTCIEICCLRISGLRTVDPPVLSVSSVHAKSSAEEPILLITTSGMDPSVEISDLARQLNHPFEEISMGEGSEAKALTSLEKCRQSGKWLILKNLQLVTYWLSVLAQNLKSSHCSDKFRLWLITESTTKFNAVLAQNCLKIAYEEPQGIGNNMQRIYASLGEQYENKLSRTSARIFFVFSMLHALLQERRKYIPQGWSKYYEFNHTDMQTGLNLTEDLWNVDTTRVQWQFITGLLSEAVYGGRIENVDDTNILETYLAMYFKDEILSHKWRPYGLNVNLPNSGQNKEYCQVIKGFPNKYPPSMFGLPENIDKAREKQMSSTLIQQLKRFYQKHTAKTPTAGMNFKLLHPFFILWKKVNQGHDFIRLSLPGGRKSASALESYVYEEYSKGVTLIQMIHKDFANFNKISKGLQEAEPNEVLAANSLGESQTPTAWIHFWNGPKDPTQYLTELLQKTDHLSIWNSKSIEELLKQPVKLSMFFSPDTFLACSKQGFARFSNVPLEELVLQTSWTSSSNHALILSGILIEGALLENGVLVACKSNSESINLTPNCYLNWTEKDKLPQDNFAKFPLYTDSSRESKITHIQVECSASLRDQYVLSGLAFYLKH